ncbi:MAG: hypothetical protein HDT28_08660 [Clostridiales bacterium]|nr:hypothetical protein [Clostridiales bacterium]
MNQADLNKLIASVEANDPTAMFIYAEYLRPTDPAGADKYILLAAYLGQPQAQEAYGDKCHADGDYVTAARFYRRGARVGMLDCSVKLAAMELETNEEKAVRELEDLAENGVKSACAALSAYYRVKGKNKEAKYWESLIKKVCN